MVKVHDHLSSQMIRMKKENLFSNMFYFSRYSTDEHSSIPKRGPRRECLEDKGSRRRYIKVEKHLKDL